MWFLAALFVVAFIATIMLTPKMKTENAKAQGLDAFSFPRANEGDPWPRLYGTDKLTSPNTLSISGFKAVPVKKKVKTGMFSSKKVTTGYQYYCTVDLAWALGPGVTYRQMWFGDNRVWTGCLYNGTNLNMIYLRQPTLYDSGKDGGRGGVSGDIAAYSGAYANDPTDPQGRDPYLVANLDPDVPAYTGKAHMVFRNFYWGNSPQIDAVSVEAACFAKALTGTLKEECYWVDPNGLDANLVEVLYDILVNDWGNLGYDPDLLDFDNWQQIAVQTWNEKNTGSILFSGASEARDAVKALQRQLNAIIYEDMLSGKTKIKLLRHDYNIANLRVLGPGIIVEARNYTRKLWSETFNVVRVKFTSRADDYAKDKIAQAKDMSLLRFQKREKGMEIQLPAVRVAELGNSLAARELSNLNVPLFAAEIVVNRSQCDLTPGDVFVWQWPEYGIVQMVMRVRKASLGTREDGRITLSIVQDEFSLDATVLAAPPPSGYIPTTLLPVSIATGVLLELPKWLDANFDQPTRPGYTRLASFMKAPSSYTLGYNAYQEDAQILTGAPYAVTATLSSPIARFAGWADGLLPVVAIEGLSSTEQLDTDAGPRFGGGMVLIGKELLVYEGYAEAGDGYELQNVHRALLDTGWEEHAIGSTVYFFEGADTFFDTDSLIGSLVDVRFTDVTAQGESPLDSAFEASALAIGRGERVIAPDYVTINGIRDAWQVIEEGAELTIDARARNRNDTTQIWYENDPASTPEPGTTYKIELEDEAGVVSLIADDVALPYVWAVNDVQGIGVLLVSAKRDGLYSISAAPMPIIVGEVLMSDGDPLTADGETITA